MTNYQEFIAGTHPRDRNSYLRFEAVNITPRGTALRFQTSPGRRYSVFRSDSLGTRTWVRFADIPPQSSANTVEINDPVNPSVARYYMLGVPQ
jgi:hypothetical protein